MNLINSFALSQSNCAHLTEPLQPTLAAEPIGKRETAVAAHAADRRHLVPIQPRRPHARFHLLVGRQK